MEHKEFRKIIENSNTVVLFIHGILGTPNHFNDFITISPAKWSICNVLLKGHGSTVDDFSKSTMSKWKNQIKNEINLLAHSYKNIIIVAHSMGTLFAINSSIENSDKIRALFLLAPPLKPILKLNIIFTIFKLLFDKYSEDDLVTLATKKAYSIDIDKNLLKYLKWIPNYISLLKEISKTKKILKLVQVETLVFFSEKDELVLKSSEKLLSKFPLFETYILKKSQHFYYDKQDYEFVLNKYIKFCEKYC